MSGTLYELIPGLKEAEERYASAQLEAFVGIEPSICGVILVNPFTPQMYIELEGCGNAFFNDKEISPEDVAAFLWRISPQYKRDDKAGRLAFLALIGVLPGQGAVDELFEYKRRAWAAMPKATGSLHSASMGSWVSTLVHAIASKYHWPEQEILNMPFRRLWQYLNRIKEEANDRYVEKCDEAESIKAEWLKNKNAEAEKCLSAK
jgi:hypothetical protein